MMRMAKIDRQRGATAMFLVIFASILFMIVTVGFIRTMVQEQVQAVDAELSRSAYDAALGGVEDGKRILTKSNCSNPADPVCAQIQNQSCDLAYRVLGIGTQREVMIQTSTASDTTAGTFDQAYTCLKIQKETNDYTGMISDGGVPEVVHLKGVGNYTKIRLSWYTKDDATLAAGSPAAANGVLQYGTTMSLPDLQAWQATNPLRPPVLRSTFIPDKSGVPHDSEDKTLYLFPRYNALNPSATASFDLDNRRSGVAAHLVMMPGGCIQSFGGAIAREYACEMTMGLPAANSSVSSSYLYLASPYAKVHYKLELLDGAGNIVKFDGVQPAIDSTGRAGDVFRRVSARVEQVLGADANALYPRATVDITNNFCKAFAVGTATSIYASTVSACDPARAGN